MQLGRQREFVDNHSRGLGSYQNHWLLMASAQSTYCCTLLRSVIALCFPRTSQHEYSIWSAVNQRDVYPGTILAGNETSASQPSCRSLRDVKFPLLVKH